MRVAAIRSEGRGRMRKALKEALAPLDWIEAVRGQRLVLVGGAWRALDRVRVAEFGGARGAPFAAELTRSLKLRVRELGARRLAGLPGVSAARAAQLDHAAALLRALVALTGVGEVAVSRAGVRHGVLFAAQAQFST